MFKTKICGIKTPDEALALIDAGADAIGLNFFGKSRRFIEPRVAEHLVARIAGRATTVGLFVNATLETVVGVADAVGVDLVQLHGEETPEMIRELKSRPKGPKVMRAFRVDRRGLKPVAEYLDRCRMLGYLPDMVLLDAHVEGQYGGTGAMADWEVIGSQREMLGDLKMVLAGGLVPDNVAEAIRLVRPDAVDTASGVEVAESVANQTSCRKDPNLVRAFVQKANEAFAEV